MSTRPPRLTPFSFVVLILVGEGGAGAHDLVRMMREGQHAIWSASASQWYAEPKRLASWVSCTPSARRAARTTR
jgi:hypothetical protein